MNAKDRQIPDWVLWLYKYGFALLFSLGIGGLLAIALAAYWIDHRLDTLEDNVVPRQAKSYQPPDLESLAAVDVQPDDFPQSQSVYVPSYSHVYHQAGRPFPLETTLSIRNVSDSASLYVQSVRYYNTQGDLVKTLVDGFIRIAPLQTVEFLVPQQDASGGSGANFVVDWRGTPELPAPLVEAVMVGTLGTRSISFRTSGVAVQTPRVAAEQAAE